MIRKPVILFLLTSLTLVLSGFFNPSEQADTPDFMRNQSQWVDSLMSNMTLEQKIGQLFVIAAYSNKGEQHIKSLEEIIKKYEIGGLLFFQGGPRRQENVTKRLQKLSKIPLLIAIDAEYGLNMRLDSTMYFPRHMTLGAIQDNTLIEKMGIEIARQCRAIGINMNLAPVADVNNNPDNPVINMRSFGENREMVAEKAIAYMKGMQKAKLLTSAKHFPGHGDTDSDSHKTLPIINHSLERLDSIELYPFKKLIEAGISGIMTAHLYVPVLDETPNKATTFSKNVINDLLQIDMGFKGLTLTDALNMRGVSAFYNPGEIDVAALLAGNDLLLFPEYLNEAFDLIKKAIKAKKITTKEIDRRVKKILLAKFWSKIENAPAKPQLTTKKAQGLRLKLYEEAITLIKNEDHVLPLSRLSESKILSLSVGEKSKNEFNQYLNKYTDFDTLAVSSNFKSDEKSNLISQINAHDITIISLFNLSDKPYHEFGITKSIQDFIYSLPKNKKIILNIFGNPYAMRHLKIHVGLDAVIVNYEDKPETRTLSAQMIMGGKSFKGKLPVRAAKSFPRGTGINTNKVRLSYVQPETINISSAALLKIDSIANDAIKNGVFPGCQILAAKKGQVFYYKGFGNHTYKGGKSVGQEDIYDLASITKIASSTLALMKLESEQKFYVDSSLGSFLPNLPDTNGYKKLNLKEMLCHQAGLVAWIPFYLRTLKSGKPDSLLYRKLETKDFTNRVADSLFILNSYRDTIFNRILSTPLSGEKKYLYSDLGYYFINNIIENITGKTQDKYVLENIYLRLGLRHIGYLPRTRWDISLVPPTENDKTFRKQLIHADVHDQGAAMLGGVCGHAGLFSNANDLAVIMQMIMDGGHYGGDTILNRDVVNKYIGAPYYNLNGNRRGIGFDKSVREGGSGPTCSLCTSVKSFGHSGFTGTLTWADPETGIVYVFLSNRVNPDAENKKIISMGIRTKIQRVITDAVKASEENK